MIAMTDGRRSAGHQLAVQCDSDFGIDPQDVINRQLRFDEHCGFLSVVCRVRPGRYDAGSSVPNVSRPDLAMSTVCHAHFFP